MKKTASIIWVSLLVTATFSALVPLAIAQAATPEAQPQAATAALSKADDEGIRKTVKDFENAWNTHDMKLLTTLFREDAEFVNVVGMHWHGRDSIVKAHAIFHEIMFKDCRLRTDSIETRPLGSEHAIAVWTGTQDTYTTPDGHIVPKGQFRLTLIMTKGPDDWKIAHGHNVRIDAEAANNDPINSRPK